MLFAVLGPLEVSHDGRSLTPTAAKQQSILAMLLLTPETVVPVPRILRQLWNEDQPVNARKSLSWHVSRLRSRLGGENRLVWRDGGYAIDLTGADLDVRRFDLLTRRAARLRHDPEQSGRLLTEALELWRGPAYGNLTTIPGIRTEAQRLEELRLKAIEDRCDADLALGRHQDLIAELSTLVDEHPLRQRFLHHYMLALYRCDRQAEALQAFRSGRSRMVDEHGLEPSPSLHRLHHDILNRAVVLDSTPAPSVTTAPSAPAELPADTVAFTGRTAVVDRITDWLTEPSSVPPVVTVSGLGGIGKSAVAVHAAHRVAARFPDGQLYIDLHGGTPGMSPLAPGEVLARMLRSLRVEVRDDPTIDELAALFRSATSSRRILVVLDNARDGEQLISALPGSPGCAVLVTTRTGSIAMRPDRHVRLTELSHNESVGLLTQLLGDDRAASEPTAIDRIAGSCGGLPLALSLVAARLNLHPGWRVERMARKLDERRLDELSGPYRAVRSTFDVTYRCLIATTRGRAAARLFRLFGLFNAQDAQTATIAAIAGVDIPTAEDLLDQLVQCQFVDNPSGDRYRMHDLVREYARESALRIDPASQRQAALTRGFDGYLATARTMGHPGASPIDQTLTGWLNEEVGSFSAVVKQTADCSPERVPPLVAALSRLLYSHGHWQLLVELAQLAVDIAADGEPGPLAIAMRDLGMAYKNLKRIPEALDVLTRARDLTSRHGLVAERVGVLGGLGNVHTLLKQHDEAVAALTESRDLAQAIGNVHSEIATLISLGLAYHFGGRNDLALTTQQAAADLADRHGHLRSLAAAQGNLGYLHQRTHRYDEAVAAFTASLEVLRANGLTGTLPEADKLWGLADSRHAQGHTASARPMWDQAARSLHTLNLITLSELTEILATTPPPMPNPLWPG
ncbi:DNA-binding SARP family transcriptional activator [Stackebrandtia endophytica]|uniref:DNA-binding SARP family transcriptional activator n=1 Tax=Stackebrandtia endophytica TaxID=1496996 RepID=A0A543B127_9ACTN|nr:BTAD domain-containing putative transcriptional regulator [Stackebrandtia endophytica]TQL78535.1 DNA-binding SARP family transcriptional activator [Stackebrandtia endophytica]